MQFWITEIVKVSCLAGSSSLLARSNERYSTRYSPGSERRNGALYCCHAPPLMRYSVRATPVPASVALSVTVTGRVPFGSVGVVDAVVTGAVSSTSAITSTVTVAVSVLPSA